jgi:hypothetical protein
MVAPLSWGANLWLVTLGWPLITAPLPGERLVLSAVAAAIALVVGALAARFGRRTLAGVAWLIAVPACVALGLSARGDEALEPLALVVIALSVGLFGAVAARALAVGDEAQVQLAALPSHGRRGTPPNVLRRARLRSALALLIAIGTLAIGVLAPTATPAELARAWGGNAREASVLVAVVAAAIACSVAAVFLSAALRPLTAFERRPPSPWRAAVGIALAILSATTYYVLMPG